LITFLHVNQIKVRPSSRFPHVFCPIGQERIMNMLWKICSCKLSVLVIDSEIDLYFIFICYHLYLFIRYVLTTLHELVAEDYILIYFHNAGNSSTNGNNMPTFNWLKQCYYMIDRKLRKNLKALYLVHPTFWLKTLVIMTKPFIKYVLELQCNLD
jgi:hypothetical protein